MQASSLVAANSQYPWALLYREKGIGSDRMTAQHSSGKCAWWCGWCSTCPHLTVPRQNETRNINATWGGPLSFPMGTIASHVHTRRQSKLSGFMMGLFGLLADWSLASKCSLGRPGLVLDSQPACVWLPTNMSLATVSWCLVGCIS